MPSPARPRPAAFPTGAALVPGSAAPDTRAYYRQRVERFASGKLATLSPYPFPVAASEKVGDTCGASVTWLALLLIDVCVPTDQLLSVAEIERQQHRHVSCKVNIHPQAGRGPHLLHTATAACPRAFPSDPDAGRTFTSRLVPENFAGMSSMSSPVASSSGGLPRHSAPSWCANLFPARGCSKQRKIHLLSFPPHA